MDMHTAPARVCGPQDGPKVGGECENREKTEAGQMDDGGGRVSQLLVEDWQGGGEQAQGRGSSTALLGCPDPL